MTGIPPESYGSAEPRSAGTTLSQPSDWFYQFFTGHLPNEAGPVVNETTSLTYSTFLACVTLIAGTIASLPLKVYKRRADGGQEEEPDVPEWRIFQVEFNPNTSAMTGREAGVGHLLTWGNSYAQVVKNRLRETMWLQPLGPDVVKSRVDSRNALVYDIYSRETGKVIDTLSRDEMIHVPGHSFDALAGMSPVRMSKSTLRAGLAMEREAERFIARGIRPPGGVKFKEGKRFKDEQAAIKYRDTFRRVHATEDSSLNVVVLEDGAEWFEIGVNPATAQLLESRKWSALEICGLMRVPPHMVGLVEKVTSWGTGVEEMTIGFVVYALLPILRRLEQEYNRKLFPSGDYFCEHVLSGLLRGDTLKQAQAIQLYMNTGLLTVNEARKLLGFNPITGGNVRYFPLSMGRVDDAGNEILPPEPAPPAATRPAIPPSGLADPLRKALVSVFGRSLRAEAKAAVQAAKKPDSFSSWVDDHYGKYSAQLEENARPMLEAWAAAFGPRNADDVAAHVDRSKRELAAVVPSPDLAASVEALTSRWPTDRLAEVAASFNVP